MTMRIIFYVAMAGWLATCSLPAQPTNDDGSLRTRLQQLTEEVQAQAQSGKHAESDYAAVLKQFDALLADKKNISPAESAQISYMKAVLYLEVIGNVQKGTEVMRMITTNYPETEYGHSAARILASMAGQGAAGGGAGAPAGDHGAATLVELQHRIQEKINLAKNAEADFADEIAELDDAIARNKKADPEVASQMLALKEELYFKILRDFAKSWAILLQATNDFPNTAFAADARALLPQVAGLAAIQKVQDGLAVGTPFPDFTATNLSGEPLSAGRLKGRLVLLDFWATWCPPCRAELPNVIATYRKYHEAGFDVIGVSLDEDRTTLENFLKQQEGMTWPQYFDGQRFGNKLASQYAVNSIPFTILIGPNGKIIAKDLHGSQLEMAVAEAMALK